MLGGAVAAAWWWFRQSRHEAAVSRIPTLVAQEGTGCCVIAGLERPWETLLPWIWHRGVRACDGLRTPGRRLAVAIAPVLGRGSAGSQRHRRGSRTLKIERQIAEAIDHMGHVTARIGVIDALASAERDSRRPLKPYLA
ncbi:MAG: hypothetical protein R3E85_07570 [Planctomycetota bacterium]